MKCDPLLEENKNSWQTKTIQDDQGVKMSRKKCLSWDSEIVNCFKSKAE